MCRTRPGTEINEPPRMSSGSNDMLRSGTSSAWNRDSTTNWAVFALKTWCWSLQRPGT